MRSTRLLAATTFALSTALASPGLLAEDKLSLDCIVEPEMTIELSSAVDGVVSEVLVDKADNILQDQVLIRLEASTQQAAVALAKSRAEMEEDVQSARLAFGLAKRKRDRVLELFQKKSVPGFEKDEAVTAANIARVELHKAENQKKLAQLELERAEAELSLRSLKSPVRGIVVERFVHPGESVNDKPLLKLAQINPLRVEILADSALFGLINEGDEAEIIIEGPAETSHFAKVSLVDGLVDAASGTFGVRLSLPNPDGDIVGGLKCRAVFPIKPPPGVYLGGY